MVDESMTMFEIAQELDRHLQAVRKILKQPFEGAFLRSELTGPQRRVMHVLMLSPGVSLKELSLKVGLAVSGIISRLERRGLARRTPGEPDRRVTRIAVTERVAEFFRNDPGGLGKCPLSVALGRATTGEQASVLEAVRKLRSLLEANPNGNKAH
jgi:DNA-binding MarR family transcriptional regulator